MQMSRTYQDVLNLIITCILCVQEEEENLFSGSKNESCVGEAMRNAVQEEEDNFFLEKGPLRAKIAGIMEKYGIKYISHDSEHCLSLCVEEHLRAVVGQLIRLTKQRVDLEKKQAEEEEKLQKLYRTSMELQEPPHSQTGLLYICNNQHLKSS